jgi:hypothetical protein
VEAIQVQAKGEQIMSTDTYDLTIAELSWHKQIVFPTFRASTLGRMDDETLHVFVSWIEKTLKETTDKRLVKQRELEQYEHDNGQDALYWLIKAEYDAEIMFASYLVGNKTKAKSFILNRIENKARYRWMKSELSDDIPWDDSDDDYDNWLF